jgi:GNAT superfamily N-acetyltransferase
MHIREAAAQDLEHIVRLFAQLGYASDPAQVEQQLRTLEYERCGRALVAEAYGALAGIAVVHLIKPIHVPAPWALLSALVVDERSRSVGIGQALLAAAEEFAMAHGCSQLELSSSSRRTRAHIFYERNAYQEKRLRFVKTLA